MNDIWYLGERIWVAYTEDLQVASDFGSIPEMKLVTTYYNSLGKIKALQFRFLQDQDPHPGRCLLHYVCRSLGLDFYRVCKLAGGEPGVPYGHVYGGHSYQPELFNLYGKFEPQRKTKKKKQRSSRPSR